MPEFLLKLEIIKGHFFRKIHASILRSKARFCGISTPKMSQLSNLFPINGQVDNAGPLISDQLLQLAKYEPL